MIEGNKRQKLIRIIEFVKKISVSDDFMWHKDALKPLNELIERLLFIEQNPKNTFEHHINADIFRIKLELEKIEKKHTSKLLNFTYIKQQKEARLLNQLLSEINDYLVKELNIESDNPKVILIKNKVNFLLIKHNVSDINDLIKLLRRRIKKSSGRELTLLQHELRALETYIEFENSEHPVDFLIEYFVNLSNEEMSAKAKINEIYQKFLDEPYSNISYLSKLGSKYNKFIDTTGDIIVDTITGQGVGVCFSSAYALTQILIYYGFNAYPVLAYRKKTLNFIEKKFFGKQYLHGAVVVDLEEYSLYLDPGLAMENPISFKGNITYDNSKQMKTIKIRIIHHVVESKINNYDTYEIQMLFGKWKFWEYLENRPVSFKEFKKIWEDWIVHNVKNVRIITLKLAKLVTKDENGKKVKYNLLLRKNKDVFDKNGSIINPFEYKLDIRRTYFDPELNRFVYENKTLIEVLNLSPSSFLFRKATLKAIFEEHGLEIDEVENVIKLVSNEIKKKQNRIAA
ncbi:hypothetical protein HN652_01015 [archaeon]|jgi:hypothetical protein|nr:hypothetical protein [archaeon]MBT6868928.1 hypothetical protein [archaeon]MBT7192851.1 hypothetical protein [archaeon]MBT7380817.1 hypothetical protein [archaeon]MBT7507572.1 hypothetical protein [archaeon]